MLQNIGILQHAVSIQEILEWHVEEISCFAIPPFGISAQMERIGIY